MNSIENNILENSKKKNVKIKEYSSLNLAYIGDAVFEIYARTKVVVDFKSTVNEMNKKTREYVNANAQNVMYHKVLEIATEEEIKILKRGRNATSNSTAKNASKSAYRHSTGLEALVGYLYLTNEITRLNEIFDFILD